MKAIRYDRLLEGKSAWISGVDTPSCGAYARLFEKHGAKVTVLSEESGFTMTAPDLTTEKCRELIREIGVPDIWLHAADLFDTDYADDLRMETMDRMLDVSLLAPFAIMRALAEPMKENGGGSVIFVSGQYGLQAINRVSAYGAAKGGEIAMAGALAMEYAADGIRVNTLVAGASFPPVGDSLLKLSGEDDTPDFWGTVQPFRRRGSPDELANAALFFASDMSAYITGETLYIDGAEHLIAHNHMKQVMP